MGYSEPVAHEWARLEKAEPGKWRLEPPISEGWYWAKFPAQLPEVVLVREDQWGVKTVWRVGHARPCWRQDCCWGEMVGERFSGPPAPIEQ